MVTLTVNDRTKAGKSFLELAKNISVNNNVIKFQENDFLSIDDIVLACRKSRKKIAKVYNEKS